MKLALRTAMVLFAVACSFQTLAASTDGSRRTSIAILDFGNSNFARLAADRLADTLKADRSLIILDRDQVRAAALGAEYNGSLNLSLTEARDLGSVIGADFFVVGDAQTLRRSPSSGAPYFESYASIFLVSSRTGRLVHWERPNIKAASVESAEELLLAELSQGNRAQRFQAITAGAQSSERDERALTIDKNTPVIKAAPDDEKVAEAEGLRLPKPFRRLIPTYPGTAAEAEAEGTVDVLVDIDDAGEVKRVDVTRWAGFGLDQATVDTVKRLQFFPAMKDGVAIPIRVLLRYNFRKPPPQ